jgi:hypothetical protein
MRESFGLPEVFHSLESTAGADCPLHVGWGSFRNLDIIAARRSEWALLLDVNVHQFAVWKAIATALSISDTPSGFIDAVLPLLPSKPPLRQFSSSTREWLEMDMERSQSWLFALSPNRFEHVRRLFVERKFEFFCLDMRGNSVGMRPPFTDFSTKLLRLRNESNVIPDTLYVSNIPWMLSQPSGFFGESHKLHLDDKGSAASICRSNLSLIAPHFNLVVTAMRLAPTSSAANLQWKSEVMKPEVFISDLIWEGLS